MQVIVQLFVVVANLFSFFVLSYRLSESGIDLYFGGRKPFRSFLYSDINNIWVEKVWIAHNPFKLKVLRNRLTTDVVMIDHKTSLYRITPSHPDRFVELVKSKLSKRN